MSRAEEIKIIIAPISVNSLGSLQDCNKIVHVVTLLCYITALSNVKEFDDFPQRKNFKSKRLLYFIKLNLFLEFF